MLMKLELGRFSAPVQTDQRTERASRTMGTESLSWV
jgi:hypothetical protein